MYLRKIELFFLSWRIFPPPPLSGFGEHTSQKLTEESLDLLQSAVKVACIFLGVQSRISKHTSFSFFLPTETKCKVLKKAKLQILD